MDTENALGELGGHAQKPRKDHPERGARTAEIDRNADTGNVAEADGAGERGGKRLERRHLTGVVGIEIIAAHQFNGVTEAAELDKSEIEREDRGGDDQPADDQRKLRPENGNGVEDRRNDRVDDGANEIADGLVDAGLGQGRT